MKNVLLLGSVMTLALAGCVSTQDKTDANTPEQKEPPKFENVLRIAYQCDHPQGKQILEAAYGIIDGKFIATQLSTNGSISPALFLMPDAPNSDTQMTYSGNGFNWVTELTTPEKLGEAKGILLSRHQMTEVNGEQVETDSTMLRNCVFDQEATKAMAAREQQK